MNSTANTVGDLRQQRRAAARAERGLAAAAAERAGHVAALALLQQDHQQQDEADEHVKSREQVVQHGRFWKLELYRSRPAAGHDVGEAA